MRLLYFSTLMHYLLKDDDVEGINIGGAATQWKSWSNGFINLKHEFGLLTFKGVSSYLNKKTVIDIVESYDPNYGIKKIGFIYHKFPKLFFAVKKYKPDYLVQASAQQYTGVLMIIAKLLGIKFIHRVAHDAHIDNRISEMIKSKYAITLYKIGFKYSDFIFAQNNYQYKKLKEQFPQKKIFKITNPFEIETSISEILPKSDRKYVAWVGNFRHMKNMNALVSVVHQFPNTKFKIAGKIYDDADKGTKLAVSKLEKFENVEFVGYIKRAEIVPFFRRASALINTSHYEGFSNTFLEAWCCGVPVVSTINVNPDKIISKYNLGKIAENFDQLGDSLLHILSLDEEKYRELSVNCFNYVTKYHDPKILAEQFINYLKQN